MINKISEQIEEKIYSGLIKTLQMFYITQIENFSTKELYNLSYDMWDR